MTVHFESPSMAFILNESEDIYWILDLESEVHSIWDLWISGLQECKANGFFEVGWTSSNFRSGPKKLSVLNGRLPLPESTSTAKFVGRSLTSSVECWRLGGVHRCSLWVGCCFSTLYLTSLVNTSYVFIFFVETQALRTLLTIFSVTCIIVSLTLFWGVR